MTTKEKNEQADFRDEIDMLKERKKMATRYLKQLLKQKKHLSDVNDELLEKANTAETNLEDLKESYADAIGNADIDTEKICKQLQTMNQIVHDALAIHVDLNGEEQFPSRISPEEYFKMEEEFTSSLTAYTKRQFFEGIAEMAGARDKLRYEILEVSNPQSLLIKGESEDVMMSKCKELGRLQSVYTGSQTSRFSSHCHLRKIQACLYKAEEMLAKIAVEPPVTDTNILSSRISELKKQCQEKSLELRRIFEDDLVPLVKEMSELQSAKVVSGNFDLKIARQDYFISKQETVVEQLLLQNARYELLSMLYEVEAKVHRDTYHLLTTAKSLLEKDQRCVENRNSLMLPYTKPKPPRETLDSRDTFMQNLYKAVESEENRSRQNHFITCDMLRSNFEDFMSSTKVDANIAQDCNENEMVDVLKRKMKEAVKLLTGNDRNSNEQKLSQDIAKIEDVLTTLEKTVKSVISEIDGKKKLLVSDSLKALQRTLFTNFFNDPTRLQRIVAELQTRVAAIGT